MTIGFVYSHDPNFFSNPKHQPQSPCRKTSMTACGPSDGLYLWIFIPSVYFTHSTIQETHARTIHLAVLPLSEVP
uniref:Ovule protein n=1 Tax=Mesocestoides corti TaxID=53468 RepID=A0A5K3EMC1_MESCO